MASTAAQVVTHVEPSFSTESAESGGSSASSISGVLGWPSVERRKAFPMVRDDTQAGF